jgi:hypothetical protein
MPKKTKAHSGKGIHKNLSPLGSDPTFFKEPHDKDILELLFAMEIRTVQKPSKQEARKEILAAVPPASHIKEILPELAGGSTVEHSVVGPTGQQCWTCGDWAVRAILSVEDLLAELKKGEHALCVLEDQNIVIQANLMEYITLQRKAAKAGKPEPEYDKPQGCWPFEILPRLIKLSPSTKYVITCHMRGQGVSREDRARYAKFPQLTKVIARLDSPSHKKFMLNLIRELYA